MAQGLSTPDPSLSPTRLSIRRGRATTTHYTHHQVSLMVLRSTTLVPSLGLRTGPACEAGLSVGIYRTFNEMTSSSHRISRSRQKLNLSRRGELPLLCYFNDMTTTTQ